MCTYMYVYDLRKVAYGLVKLVGAKHQVCHAAPQVSVLYFCTSKASKLKTGEHHRRLLHLQVVLQ